MTLAHIQQSIEGVTRYFAQHPDKALSTDKAATAVIEQGLRCVATGPGGETLVITVDSVSDDRGILGLGEGVPPGPQSVSIRVRIAAEGVSAEQLHEIVAWAEAHSPVGDAVRRAVPSRVEVTLM